MDFDLKDRVALVTGSGSQIGFGRAIALTLAKEGCDIIVTDIDIQGAKQTEAEINGLGRNAISVEADVSSSVQVGNMVKIAMERFGRIDILVNNAGIGLLGKPFLEMTEDEWNWVINVNFIGMLNCTKAVLPQMINRKSGKIINISSAAGRTGIPMGTLYAASKAAIINFTKSLGAELAPMGINVNGVAPGAAKTNIGRHSPPEFGDKVFASLPPIGRLVETQDIANMVTFLASDISSDMVGQNISVDGGLVMF